MINALVSQQIGFGFHTSGKSPLYSHFHCYLNIPDTSDRDSLFQSEAKRCKEILDVLEQRPKHEMHLCLMDELFSGTNPEEAVAGASAFLKHISKYNNMHYILTTHYIKLCKMLREKKTNCGSTAQCIGGNQSRPTKCIQMECKMGAGTNLEYTYLVKSGITKIKGGTSVMRNAGFPKSIINEMESRLKGGTVPPKPPVLGGSGRIPPPQTP
jgi:DNA mismatch repair ATPase MutS